MYISVRSAGADRVEEKEDDLPSAIPVTFHLRGPIDTNIVIAAS